MIEIADVAIIGSLLCSLPCSPVHGDDRNDECYLKFFYYNLLLQLQFVAIPMRGYIFSLEVGLIYVVTIRTVFLLQCQHA